MTDALMRFGLRENEAVLYEILLSNVQCTIQMLQKISPFSRTMLYYILQNLHKKNLIIIKKNKTKTVYEPYHPEQLAQTLEEQERELRYQKKIIGEIMPDLVSNYQLHYHKPNIRFFEGEKGIRKALDETLNTKTKFFSSIINFDAIENFVPEINEEAFKKKKKRGVTSQHLVYDTPLARSWYETLDENKDDKSSHRFLPKTIPPQNIILQIYENKITYYSLRKDNKMAVIIDDKDISGMQLALFHFFWDMSALNG